MDEISAFVFFFIVFTAIHSLMAADFFKIRLERNFKIYFRFYRLFYILVSSVTVIPVLLVWKLNSALTPLVYSVPLSLHPILYLIRLAAIGFFVYAAIQTDIFEFIGIRQLQKKYLQKKNELITRGAYGIVRHPLYTGGILMLLTMFSMTRLDAIAVILISIYMIIGAFLEEKRMLVIFGEKYREYQKNVSMFIPLNWIKNFTQIILLIRIS